MGSSHGAVEGDACRCYWRETAGVATVGASHVILEAGKYRLRSIRTRFLAGTSSVRIAESGLDVGAI